MRFSSIVDTIISSLTDHHSAVVVLERGMYLFNHFGCCTWDCAITFAVVKQAEEKGGGITGSL